MIESEVNCPFCGEVFVTLVDGSQNSQSYIEDCFVCCRPIQFLVQCEAGELLSIQVDRS